MAVDVVAMLDAAVAQGRAAGLQVDGWTMQSADDGYVAWLFQENDEGQTSLFDAVDVKGSAEEAARTVMVQLLALTA